MKIKALFFSLFLLLGLSHPVFAYWVWSPEEGRFVNPEGEAQDVAEEQYNYAMQFYKEKNLSEAKTQLESLLKKYPASFIASEAQYRLGRILEEEGQYLKAISAYNIVVEAYPHSERLTEVIERQYKIANLFLSGKKGKLMGLEILPSLSKAVEIYDHIVQNAPYSEYGDKALFQKGFALRKMGKFSESINAFEELAEQYPQSELVEEARFQIAETSYRKSQAQFRDQRALEDASKQVDRFLTRYPANAEASEKAANLRQQIDEKNAEKNYRIGYYYEKTNYLSSAMIYYEDVARRYAHTKWGRKAEERMQTLKQPVEFLGEQAEEISTEREIIKKQLSTLPKEESFERTRLERKLEILDRKNKELEETKVQSLKSRREDIKRREEEIKQKEKKLKNKKELLEKNPSEDLNRALNRWALSIDAEKQAILEEKRRLADWEHSLGVKTELISLDFLPFIGDGPSELERIQNIEAKKYYKIAQEKKELLGEKENLYRKHSQLATQIESVQGKYFKISNEKDEFMKSHATELKQLEVRDEQVQSLQRDIKQLEAELEEYREIYEQNYGKKWVSWVTAPAKFVAASTELVTRPITKPLQAINPFDRDSDLESMSIEQLLERRMHTKEKVAAQQSLISTLNQAFDSELALKERQRLLDSLESTEEIDPHALRKDIRKVEKDIRSRYNEIRDRHNVKKEALEEIEKINEEAAARQKEQTAGLSGLSKPVDGVKWFTKSFLFGLVEEDVTITQKAKKVPMKAEDVKRVAELQEKLEEESLLIEARYREIENLKRELEILKAKSSLAGGFKFRSAMVDIPYAFIKEAIESAGRLVPGKDREETILHMLDEETRELDALQNDLKEIEKAINVVSGDSPKRKLEAETVEPVAEEEVHEKVPSEESAVTDTDEEALKIKIEQAEALLKQHYEDLQSKITTLKQEKSAIEKELTEGEYVQAVEGQSKEMNKEEEELRKRLADIEAELIKVIEDEKELETKEFSILHQRIDEIDKVIEKSLSKAIIEDLMVERERMEERMSQIELRKSFLSKELKRFQLSGAAA